MSTSSHDQDVDPGVLRQRLVAVLGYGNQGHAHALNLRDSGCRVIVGQRPGPGWDRARADGFETLAPAEVAERAGVILMTLPDEVAPAVYEASLRAHLRPGDCLGFVHGFNIHYRRIVPPAEVDVVLVAPKGAGYMVRRAYREGGGLACLVAVQQDAGGQAWDLARGWARGIGGGRAGILDTTFAAETETDLFGEQASVVGGVCAVMTTAFETLVRAGYEPEHAYFECIHEVKFVVDLIHRHGMAGMLKHISRTAAFGAASRGPRLTDALRPLMAEILKEIRDGRFAAEWASAGGDTPPSTDAAAIIHPLAEEVGQRLRALSAAPGNPGEEGKRKYPRGSNE